MHSDFFSSTEKQDEVKKIKKKITELGTQFGSNLNEDTTFMYFDKEELKGVSTDLIDSFEKNDQGQCKVTMKYPHFFPVTRKCQIPETRQKIETTYQSRCLVENTKILEELVQLRQKQADLLGMVHSTIFSFYVFGHHIGSIFQRKY